MKLRLILFVPILMMLCGNISAQKLVSDRIRPQWTKKTPMPTNGTFCYEIVTATGRTLDSARNAALAGLVSNSGLQNGVVAVSDHTATETLSQKWENGKLTESIEHEGRTNTSLKSSEMVLHIKDIDEYWQTDSRGNYNITKLYARAETGIIPAFDNVRKTAHYGARGLWRSLIIPGWGQFHKGSYAKGGIMLGGCALAASGIIFCESMRKDCYIKTSQTHDVNLIRRYSVQAANYATTRNICIGAAAALYLYNLIDAVAAPGARRLIITPVAYQDNSLGISANLKF